MKKHIILITAALAFGTTLFSQDDMYFASAPKKKAKAQSAYKAPVTTVQVADPSTTAYSGNDFDVDAYNRRYATKQVSSPGYKIEWDSVSVDAYTRGYNDAASDNYNAAYSSGYSEGYSSGFSDGDDYSLTSRLYRFSYPGVFYSYYADPWLDPWYYDTWHYRTWHYSHYYHSGWGFHLGPFWYDSYRPYRPHYSWHNHVPRPSRPGHSIPGYVAPGHSNRPIYGRPSGNISSGSHVDRPSLSGGRPYSGRTNRIVGSRPSASNQPSGSRPSTNTTRPSSNDRSSSSGNYRSSGSSSRSTFGSGSSHSSSSSHSGFGGGGSRSGGGSSRGGFGGGSHSRGGGGRR